MCLLGLATDACKGHLVSGDVLAGVGQIGEEMFGSPGNSRTLHGFAVPESSGPGRPAQDAAQRRSSRALAIALNQCIST